jgi:uncharacterized protein
MERCSKIMDKLTRLINILKDMESAVLAYSGGADSTFLLKAMQLSGIRALAVTAVSEIMPRCEVLASKKMAKELGIKHMIIETHELSNKKFVSNTPERCFVCKDNRFKILKAIAISEGYRFVIEGSNIDDMKDVRPGTKAAAKYGVRSPLIEAGFSKKKIREVSKELGLPTWNKPSSPCLSTRFPYGQRITKEALKRVERAEDLLRTLGFYKVRVRDHGGIARIEVEEDKIGLLLIPEKRKIISEKLKALGYEFVCLDLDGYKSGSLNRVLKDSLSL